MSKLILNVKFDIGAFVQIIDLENTYGHIKAEKYDSRKGKFIYYVVEINNKLYDIAENRIITITLD